MTRPLGLGLVLGFGPTLAAEKLREDHGISVGRETLRQWMIEAGLWRDRKQPNASTSRGRGASASANWYQVDGSEHWWFEDRVPQCTLLVFIDDATRRLMHLQFVRASRPLPISMRPAPIWRPGASRSSSRSGERERPRTIRPE
jgi:hypothetical protein